MKRFSLDETKRVRELSTGMWVKFTLALALSHGRGSSFSTSRQAALTR